MLHKSTGSTSAATIAHLEETIPRTYARMINRPMRLVGGVDVPIHRQGL
jgi:hypothetical protein